jgi:hypothetical protein
MLAGVFAVARDDALVDPVSTLPLIKRVARTRPSPSPPTGQPERRRITRTGCCGLGHGSGNVARL